MSLAGYDDDFMRAAQERYDRWVCANGTSDQKRHVGTKNGSRVRCDATGGSTGTGDIEVYPRMEEVPGPPLNLPSRRDQKQNIFTKAFDPRHRKIIVLLIAGFLLFYAVINYD